MEKIVIKGMSCAHCVKAVEKALSEIEGVTQVRVDLSAGVASVESEKPLDMAVVKEKIEKAGYQLG